MIGRSFRIASILLALTDALAPRSVLADGFAEPELEFVVLGSEQMVRIAVDVRVDGQRVTGAWDASFDKLLAHTDRNDDGAIDESEASKLPSPFSLRQAMWHPFVTFPGTAPAWEALDADDSGKVDRAELAAFYRHRTVGQVTVGFGRPPHTAALGAALVEHLDIDGDARLTAIEWQAAAATLRPLDCNGDELVAAEELVDYVQYPGATGNLLLAAADESQATGVPLIVLPHDRGDNRWTALVISRRDRDGDGRLAAAEVGLGTEEFAQLDDDEDGTLTAEELAEWRNSRPAATWQIDFPNAPAGKPTVRTSMSDAQVACEIAAGGFTFNLRVDAGKLPAAVQKARKQFGDGFAEADINRNGVVSPDETAIPSFRMLKYLTTLADRNGDGQLDKDEMTLWLDDQQQIAKGHVLLSLLDHGPGLFELVDCNHDGALSVRELRTALQRLNEAGAVTDGSLDAARLPRSIAAIVSHGQPRTLLAPPEERLSGPGWFRAMDRNRDGDISAREFLGTKTDFHRLDEDGDGLVGLAEAEQVRQ